LLVFPTAMQAERDTQDAAFRILGAAPGGLGVRWMLQVLPSHRSASVAGDGWLTKLAPLGVEKPTAVHPVAEVQATPISWPIAPPGRRGVGWIAQLVPFHRSATGWAAPEELKKAPAAMQADADAQATVFRKVNCAPAGLGVGWMLQLVPFHRSARVPVLEDPAAVHADADVQATPFSPPPPWGGLGVAWIDHRLPFHRSARVLALGVKGLEAPAAMHVVVDVQATPLRKPLPWGGLGVAWIDHRVPFHRSASGPAPELPTAVHADAEVQDTPFRPPPWDRLGVGWIRHRVPSHRSARAREAPPMMPCPTAVHADGVLQATPNRALIVALAGLGVGRMRHEVPFHRSASVTPAPEALV
jgi:hypothetical protein